MLPTRNDKGNCAGTEPCQQKIEAMNVYPTEGENCCQYLTEQQRDGCVDETVEHNRHNENTACKNEIVHNGAKASSDSENRDLFAPLDDVNTSCTCKENENKLYERPTEEISQRPKFTNLCEGFAGDCQKSRCAWLTERDEGLSHFSTLEFSQQLQWIFCQQRTLITEIRMLLKVEEERLRRKNSNEKPQRQPADQCQPVPTTEHCCDAMNQREQLTELDGSEVSSAGSISADDDCGEEQWRLCSGAGGWTPGRPKKIRVPYTPQTQSDNSASDNDC